MSDAIQSAIDAIFAGPNAFRAVQELQRNAAAAASLLHARLTADPEFQRALRGEPVADAQHVIRILHVAATVLDATQLGPIIALRSYSDAKIAEAATDAILKRKDWPAIQIRTERLRSGTAPDSVCSQDLGELERFAKSVTLDQATRDLIFNAVVPYLCRAGQTPRQIAPFLSSVPKILLTIDRQRGSSILVAADVMTVQNWELPHVLEACAETSITIPNETLARLLADLPDAPSDFHRRRIGEGAYPHVRRSDPERARQMLESLLTSSDGSSRDFALRGLLEIESIKLPEFQPVRSLFKQRSPKSMLGALRNLIGQIESDGVSSAREHASSKHWEFAIEAARLIGASQLASDLRYAWAMPALTNERVEDGPLKAIEDRILDDAEHYATLIWRYVIDHRSEF